MKTTLTIVLAAAISFSFAGKTTTEYYPNGQKKSEGAYSADVNIAAVSAAKSKEEVSREMGSAVKVGQWTFWYENGTKSAEQTYTDAGVMTGTSSSWYMNGQKSSEVNFTTSKATYWYENGQKQSEGNILSGMLFDGKWSGWYENGKMNYSGSYTKGNKEGEWIWYDSNGNMTQKEMYTNGKKTN